MRLTWSRWLVLPLLCSSSCESGDNCGPTSEWPSCATGDNAGSPSEPVQGGGDDDSAEEPPKPGGGSKKDAGKASTGVMDAGVRDAASQAPSTSDGESSGASGDGGADAGDGGAPVDARVQTIDGGPADCTIDSDGRDGGACYGVYCSVPQAEFSSLASAAGACSGGDLALACDGEFSRVVSQCAQDDVLALGFGRTVALCAGRAPSLAKASEGCVSCYVDELLCALENCLTPCLSGSAGECTSCRLDRCGLEFRTCSGLPAASQYLSAP
jgi:hypothetical protein